MAFNQLVGRSNRPRPTIFLKAHEFHGLFLWVNHRLKINWPHSLSNTKFRAPKSRIHSLFGPATEVI